MSSSFFGLEQNDTKNIDDYMNGNDSPHYQQQQQQQQQQNQYGQRTAARYSPYQQYGQQLRGQKEKSNAGMIIGIIIVIIIIIVILGLIWYFSSQANSYTPNPNSTIFKPMGLMYSQQPYPQKVNTTTISHVTAQIPPSTLATTTTGVVAPFGGYGQQNTPRSGGYIYPIVPPSQPGSDYRNNGADDDDSNDDDNDIVKVIRFFSNKCPISQKFDPIWNRLQNEIKTNGYPLKPKSVDASLRHNLPILGKFGVTGTPVVVVVLPNGKADKLVGFQDYPTLWNFISSKYNNYKALHDPLTTSTYNSPV